jgi:two-component system cell cycle sensor histidine kinase/response regulator CckA
MNLNDTPIAADMMATILFVEDEDFLRTVIAEVLSSAGYRVLVAADGVEASTVRAQYSGKVNLLLTDFCMPLKNGEVLCQELSAVDPTLKTIFISGYAEVDGNNVPVNVSFLPKPFSIHTLLRKIRETLTVEDPENEMVSNDCRYAVVEDPEEVQALAAVS